jgi:hypothetical protein
MIDDIGPHLRTAHKNLKLVELVVRDSINGFQAIVKFAETQNGPWGVGCDIDPIDAIEKALKSGAHELELYRLRLKAEASQFDDLLG